MRLKLFRRRSGSQAARPEAAAEALERRTLLSQVVVNTTSDQVDPAGSLTVSLRDAVTIADGSTTPTFISFDPIVFAVPKTIVLGGTKLILSNTTEPTTIAGPSTGVAISGNYAISVLVVQAGVTATLNGVSIIDGNNESSIGGVINGHGGGLNNSGTLIFENASVTGNVAGGEGGGGGIFNVGTITVLNVDFENNQAGGAGGGFENYGPGTATLTAVTVANNTTVSSPNTTSSPQGGGIASDCHTGYTTTIQLRNVTVASNSTQGAGGGIWLDGSNTGDSLVNVTIADNTAVTGGGGIAYGVSAGGLSIGNSVVARNTITAVGAVGPDVKGTIISTGHNFVSEADGGSGWVSSDLTGTVSTPLNPKMGLLAYNGGPTRTILPTVGSPLINAGSNALIPADISTDQRGLPRIANVTVDIGAVEVQPATALELQPVGGNFVFISSTQQYSFKGTVNIGLVPAGQAAFVPLLQEAGGAVAYDSNNITASGTFTALQANLGGALFTGSFTVPDAATTTSVLSAAAGVTVAGLNTTFSSLTFATGVGGTTYDSRLTLAGGFVLPPSLGSASITLPSGSPFVVGPGGFQLSTGMISVPSASFELGGVLQLSAKSMSFQYTPSIPELEIQGDFSTSLKSGTLSLGLNLNLTGDNFIDYEPNQTPSVKFAGTLTYADPTATAVFNNWFSITAAQLTVNTVTDTVGGSVTLQVPSGKTFSGSISFLNGYLDSIGLGAGSQLGIPVPSVPGLLVQNLSGALTGLAPSDPNPTQITGAIEVTYAKLVKADLTTVITLGADNAVDDIKGQAVVNIANGQATGNATLDANIQAGTFGLTSLMIQAFNNHVTVQGALVGSTAGTLDGFETGTFTFPSLFFGGATVSGTSQFHIASSGDPAQSYVGAWTQLTVFGAAHLVGVRFGFDGSVALLNASNLPTTTAAISGSRRKQMTPAVAPASASQAFIVAAGTPFILLTAAWTNPMSGVPFQVVAPDGTVYNSANLNTAIVATVPTLSSQTATTVAVNAPSAGTWQLIVPDTTNLGTVSFGGTAPTAASAVAVTSPAAAVPAGSVSIGYSATDPNAGAQVSLYYDTQGNGLQGTLIASGLPVGTGTYRWQTPSTLPAGTYYIYAVVTDSVAVPSSAYASGTVVATASNAQPLSLSGPTYSLKLDADGQHLGVWTNGTEAGTISESLLLSAVSTVLVTGVTGGTTVTVDFSAGDPLPATGLAFIGAAEAANTLDVIGTSGNDVVTATDSTVIVSAAFGSATIVYGGLSAIAFSGGAGSDTLIQAAQPGNGATLAFAGTAASDTLAVNAGTYTVPAAPAGSGITAVPLGSLIIAGGAKVAIANPATAPNRSVLVVANLTDAGTLDVGGNDMIVTSGTVAAVSALAAAGFAGGTWAGPGIDSSAAAADPKHLAAVGVIQNVNGSAALYPTFDGVAVTSSAVLVKYTVYGDTNLDGVVTAADYSRVDAGFVGRLTGWANGDFNYDGAVDGTDYALMDNAFNQQPAAAPAAAVVVPSAVAVPTPPTRRPPPAAVPVVSPTVPADDDADDERRKRRPAGRDLLQ